MDRGKGVNGAKYLRYPPKNTWNRLGFYMSMSPEVNSGRYIALPVKNTRNPFKVNVTKQPCDLGNPLGPLDLNRRKTHGRDKDPK